MKADKTKTFLSPIPVLLLPLLLSSCLPPPDQPAWYGRMGRFLGLVANCGCSDISPDKMIAEYTKALGGRYTPDETRAMRGYVMLAATERWDNRVEVCGEVCAQRCMVQTVVEPLGGRGVGAAPCPVTEIDLHLTDGHQIETSGGSFP
jgi:hypothetical protein